MAVRFGKLFGNGSGFWVNLQRNYDLVRAERTVDVSGIPTLEVRGAWEGRVALRKSQVFQAALPSRGE
ncbi:MAG: hypothetical protein OXL41_02895 [Nitrospinae bacterium]|nr:hypothetical protein [Nitrospinota bacterium]